MHAGAQIILLHRQLQLLLGSFGGAAAATVHLQTVTFDDIADGVRFFLRGGQRLAVLAGFLTACLQLFAGGGQLRLHGGAALGDLADRGLQRRQLRTLIGGGITLQHLLGAERICLAGSATGRIGHAAHLVQQSFQLLLQRLGMGVDLHDTLIDGIHLTLQRFGAVAALGHLLLKALHGLGIMLHTVFQHGDTGFQLGGFAVQLARLGAERFGFHIVLPHLLGTGIRLGIDGIQRILSALLIFLRRLEIALQLEGRGFQRLQLLQPHGNLQHAQLIAEDEVFLCRLRLLAQRLYLQLQLGDLIVDTHQILFGARQLALRLLLAVAELGDTCRLLKDLAALTALDGQNLINLALTDDRVALAAHTCVHKQLVDVLQAHGLLIDIILRFTAAVVTARHRHFRLIAVEDMLGIVDDQRNLRKAHLVALLRAAEDDILHLGTAELAAVLLTHNPADGIGNVGLTAAVGTDDGGNILAEVQYRLLGKGFKTLNFQCF